MATKVPVMTWRQLRDYLNRVNDVGTLDSSVMICHGDEFFGCDIMEVEPDCPQLGDILDEGHPYIETIVDLSYNQ